MEALADAILWGLRLGRPVLPVAGLLLGAALWIGCLGEVVTAGAVAVLSPPAALLLVGWFFGLLLSLAGGLCAGGLASELCLDLLRYCGEEGERRARSGEAWLDWLRG